MDPVTQKEIDAIEAEIDKKLRKQGKALGAARPTPEKKPDPRNPLK